MRLTARAVFSLFLLGVSGYAVLSTLGWSLKPALFPRVIGIPLFVLAAVQLGLDLWGRGEAASGTTVDMEFAADVPPPVARRRTASLFAWIVGFILLVSLVGFPVAVPVFMFSYLSLQGQAGWWLSLGLTAVAWGFFYGLFQRLLHFPFEEGWIQTWLGL